MYSCAVRLSLVTIYYAVFLFDCARHSARSKRSRLSPTRCSVLGRYECAAARGVPHTAQPTAPAVTTRGTRNPGVEV